MRALTNCERVRFFFNRTLSGVCAHTGQALMAIAIIWLGSSCSFDTYDFGDEEGWELPDAAVDKRDSGAAVDAEVDACVPADEVCDGLDNDCDGETDEDFNLDEDPSNCGECSNVCEYDNAFADCQQGNCGMGACLPGFWDNNEDESDGCEYSCLQTNAGEESCDTIDNDCDGETDEVFDLQNDTENCGQCHRVCVFFRGEGACVGGQCTLDYCHSGYVDKDNDPDNGCECLIDASENSAGNLCDPTNLTPCAQGEVCVDRNLDGTHHCSALPTDECDGVDNDCDGATDEDSPVGDACYSNPTGCTYDSGTDTWSCLGQCQTGNMGCVGGVVQCTQQQGPAGEACDGLDNDCDGATDEDFDFQNDPSNCGDCNTTCTQTNIPDSVPGCANGACVVVACLPGFYDLDGVVSNGCEYECSLTNGGQEACGDSVDNDCDGETDEGFDLQNDTQNCGNCGNVCQFANATADCQSGGCVLVDCLSGFWNADGNDSNGCEYSCSVTNTGTEICDGLDNDCNGTTDDGFDKNSDTANCGSCGYNCADHIPTGAQVVSCNQGQCIFSCMANNHDLNGDLGQGETGDGCEYACTVNGSESCDGADNDCDGVTDEDSEGDPLTQPCYTGPPATEAVGICRGGTATCVGGGWGVCVGEVIPEPNEQCDSEDHDCDGDSLNGFDLTTDILNCGGCGNSCFDSAPSNAYAFECSASTCQYACESGYFNVDGDWSDGCEYACDQTSQPGTEYCDGVDNDCDSLTDEVADLVPPPSGYCRTDAGTPCEGTTASCTTGILGVTWYCNYSADVEVDPANPNRVVVQENLCDEIDGNCDGVTDEVFTDKGDYCDDGQIGACLSTGHYVCDATQTGTICQITDPGATPTPEVCNGIDDDCNGLLDDNASDTMVHVTTLDGSDFYIDAYEASRPDATSSSIGTLEHRACSNPGVIPWYNVSWDEAAAACAAAGKRLCEEGEWQLACEGPSGYSYPYGDNYEPQWCNGNDYDPDCEDPDNDYVLPTSTPHGCPPPADTLCISDYSAIDMSGNLMEWTGTQSSASPLYYRIRGGAYDNIEPALTCQFDFISADPTFYYGDIGFRCCSDTAP